MQQINRQYHQIDEADQRPVLPGFQAVQAERAHHHVEVRLDSVAHSPHPRLPAGLDAFATSEAIRWPQHPFKLREALAAKVAPHSGIEPLSIVFMAVAGQQRPVNEQSPAVYHYR